MRDVDERGCLRVDERLEGELHAVTDDVDVTAGTERVEKRVRVKLLLGHRGDFLCRVLSDMSRFTSVPRYVVDRCSTHTASWDASGTIPHFGSTDSIGSADSDGSVMTPEALTERGVTFRSLDNPSRRRPMRLPFGAASCTSCSSK